MSFVNDLARLDSLKKSRTLGESPASVGFTFLRNTRSDYDNDRRTMAWETVRFYHSKQSPNLGQGSCRKGAKKFIFH